MDARPPMTRDNSLLHLYEQSAVHRPLLSDILESHEEVGDDALIGLEATHEPHVVLDDFDVGVEVLHAGLEHRIDHHRQNVVHGVDFFPAVVVLVTADLDVAVVLLDAVELVPRRNLQVEVFEGEDSAVVWSRCSLQQLVFLLDLQVLHGLRVVEPLQYEFTPPIE